MLVIKSIEEVESNQITDFSCGNENLDIYLKKFARQNSKKGIGKSFIALQNNVVIGFYTISMSSIEFDEIPKNYSSGIPKYPLPIAKIGRLAVDTKFQGKKIGSILLVDALKKIYQASQTIAAYAVVVDAKDSFAKQFYEKFGFVSYKNELSLFLPMNTIEKLLQ